jgi:acyl-CoA thioester hydrolase
MSSERGQVGALGPSTLAPAKRFGQAAIIEATMESHDVYIEGQRLDRGPGAPAEDSWGYSFPIVVRFSDIDAMGHVNNAVYLTYCEMARVGYLRTVAGMRAITDMTMILARAEIDYRMPIEFNDALAVQVRATAIGTKSFTLHYRMVITRHGAEHIACAATSVQVCYDYTERRSVPVPAALIDALETFEGRRLRR